ncbi:MAG: site-2 protease family protein [Candidatus Bathyarchaeota archaeon]|nr:site-2 protease family protein [Candidatus Bathyarchaeota archaeon]
MIDPNFFFELFELVKTEFTVSDAYVRDNVPTFTIKPEPNLNQKLLRLKDQVRGKDLEVQLTQDKELQIQLVPRITRPSHQVIVNYSLPLFIITIITVTISGYFIAGNYLNLLNILGRDSHIDWTNDQLTMTFAYTISIIATLGVHELGHILACRIHGIEASMPIFLPGIPLLTLGTFGAVIRQKSPTVNRNQLFDIGFMGPLFGFILSLIISIWGYSLSLPLSRTDYQLLTTTLGEGDFVVLPFIFQTLQDYIFPNANSFSHILHPIAFAGWLTTLLTFLNIFPIGQLDGGHIAWALFGPTWHRRISYIMIPIMILTGWWSMAILILFFLRQGHPGTINEITGVSRTRKLLSILVIVIFLTCFTPSSSSPLLSLLYP